MINTDILLLHIFLQTLQTLDSMPQRFDVFAKREPSIVLTDMRVLYAVEFADRD